jgi:anti-anti-sigma factor
MEYSLERRDSAIIARVSGRVDESSWEAFSAALGEAIGQAREAEVGDLVIDLGHLDYMSSRGLRALTVAKRQADEAEIVIRLAAPNEVMREILAISRYDKLFMVTETIEVKR